MHSVEICVNLALTVVMRVATIVNNQSVGPIVGEVDVNAGKPVSIKELLEIG